ncbi:collagen-like triple helix repeat-containing protein [Bradyrhizobium monzae]|uniref:collagen-like triple helix repeat-containing protein n=1 Tax=Bradyrhizobium sp. Oc8 TaxID=2876780 RepID=UPI001F284BDC|nr:collagen-like protein [Bradyrhizobium sp. Oc8]
MSGKSRGGGVIGNSTKYDTAAKDSPTVAATISTEAIQASWAQYVESLVREQVADVRDGVIRGLGEGINEQLDRLFDETNKFLRRELDSNSAKLETALAEVRAAKTEMREEIRAELRAEIRTEIADRVALIKQPVDGAPGPAGPPGKLEIVKDHVEGRVYYERDLIVANGALYQAERDTAAMPPHTDWLCITRPGQDGMDALNFRIEGTYDPAEKYRRLSIVTMNGSSFVARHDDPGSCPGDGWQLFASAGRRGQQGPKGDRGERGPPGPSIKRCELEPERYTLVLQQSDGTSISINLRPFFAAYHAECNG